MNTNFYEAALGIKDELTGWRRSLHKNPEVGLSLPQTTRLVMTALDAMAIPYTFYEDISCITALIGDPNARPCILLRADMDALPIAEETDLDYAAENGCMHACGHDLHAAMLLGAAKLLKAHEGDLQGCVKLLFQSGEEIFAGAEAAIQQGILENPKPDAAYAMHVASTLPLGVVAYGDNPMAAVYGFQIHLKGKGGHGSQPDQSIDPINTGVHIYLALQELIARECAPSAEAALTIGQFSAGAAENIIPETATLKGTLRTFDPKVTDYLIRRIEETALGISQVYRTQCELTVLSKVPSVVCDPALNALFLGALEGLPVKILPGFHVMGSEDFAFIASEIPSSYFSLGAGVSDPEKWVGQHNPKVLFNESVLPIGAACYAQAAMTGLEQLK